MLRFLSVRHLAVIDRLEVEFEPGLNIVTGETGAGKTMLVEAIDLLIGGRASADLVRTGEQLAAVQAIVERPGAADQIVRREVSAQGRSRAFIDDALATTAALRDLGARHIDLYGQHEHQALLDPEHHVALLDDFAGHGDRVDAAAAAFQVWRSAIAALERTQLDDREKRARIDMASFQLQEIDRARPVAGEDDRLTAERAVLANAHRLERLRGEAYDTLYDNEHSALTALAGVWKRVGELAEFDERFAVHAGQRDDIKSRLEDLAFLLRSYAADLDASPERLQSVEDRLAALERIKKKHGPTLEDVLERARALREELSALQANDERAAILQRDADQAAADFLRAARELSAARQSAARSLEAALARELRDLAMPRCRIEIRTQSHEKDPSRWASRGIDEIEFFISPNPGEDVRPLARIASGGELSRVMLALRTLAITADAGRTLIFDEVDAGIGGAAADAVGARLKTLADRHQVLCITHLPQIAARADAHFQIAKQVRGGRTVTVLNRLDLAGREHELARMIAGARVSPQVLASAREMINERQRKGETSAKGESEAAKAKGNRRGA